MLSRITSSPKRAWELGRVVAAGLNVVAAIVVLTPLVLLVVGAIVAFLTSATPVALLCVGLLVGAISPLIFVVLLLPGLLARFARGYRWERAEYSLELDPQAPDSQTFRLRLNVLAVRPHVTVVENRYHWTGEGTQQPPVVERGARGILGPIPVDMWQYYYIHLGRSLPINGTREIVIRQEFEDIGETFQPFFAKTVIEPIEVLVLRVRFLGNTVPGSVWATAGYPQPTTTAEADISDKLLYDGHREARLEVRNPQHNRRYAIKWE